MLRAFEPIFRLQMVRKFYWTKDSCQLFGCLSNSVRFKAKFGDSSLCEHIFSIYFYSNLAKPLLNAVITAWVRSLTPNLLRILLTWNLTVPSVILRIAAIS